MSFLHKVQVKRRGSSVQTEKVKLQGKKEVGASNQIGLYNVRILVLNNFYDESASKANSKNRT